MPGHGCSSSTYEVGYLSDNRPFAEWGEVFPNAACVVSLIDRLVHHAEIIHIDGESFRLKEAKELVEGVPAIALKAVAKEEAETIKEKLEKAGCQVNLK